MHYNFKDDLEEAQAVEVSVINFLREVVPNFEFNGFSGTKGYDAIITISDRAFYLEIKSDYITQRTGNIAIEYESRGSLSGISTSKAHFYAYAVMLPEGMRVYFMNSNKIRKLIENELYHSKTSGGDIGSNTKFYLFKEAIFAEYGKVLVCD